MEPVLVQWVAGEWAQVVEEAMTSVVAKVSLCGQVLFITCVHMCVHVCVCNEGGREGRVCYLQIEHACWKGAVVFQEQRIGHGL